MNPQLHNEITTRIISDYGLKLSGEYLGKGECPSCSKKELYTHAEKPWVLRCGRLNKCGAELHIKDLYSDLFNVWTERYPVTPQDPNASADAYLRDGRGFNLSKIAGWYKQESYFDHKQNIGSATVRFALANGYFERIIDKPHRFGARKATIHGEYKGTWWQPPGSDLAVADEIWITEGIFNSIALLHHNVVSVSALSCVNFPDKSLKAIAEQCAALDKPRPKLVWALDGDKAGRGYTRKHVARSIEAGWEATAAQIPQAGKAKLDWNDMHQRDRLDEKSLKEYRYHGALMLCKNAHDKALLIYNHDGFNSFHMEYDNRLWWFEVNLEKFGKAKDELSKAYDDLSDEDLRNRAMMEAHTLREIANCYPVALYYQATQLTDESWYYLRIDFPHDGAPVKNTFTGAQLASASEFKKRLLGVAPGAVFTGSAAHLDRWIQRATFNIKTVSTVDFIGYSKDHKTWVFNDVAVSNGQVVQLNDEDYFDIGKLSIKSLSRSPTLHVNASLNEFATNWVSVLWQCYQHKGIVALAFWFGSLFAEQIRDQHGSFPFIELVGEPGAGKSTLIEFLWRLVGRTDYEGFDPVKSTMAARARNFSQVSNMPVVLIEGDRSEEDRNKQKGFDWDELKPLFNGRSVYSRGVKNSGNETYEPPFRGALVISQNAPVSASDAILQRILHVGFDLSSHTQESKAMADALGQLGTDVLSGFLLKACMAEKAIIATINERIPYHEKSLLKIVGVRNLRIVKNHAMLAALVDALSHVVTISPAERDLTHAFIEDMTTERQESINADHKLVQEFWEMFDFLNDGEEERLNHSRDEELIAVNLNHFVTVAADMRQQLPPLAELKRVLKTSRARKFIEVKTVSSALNARFNTRKLNNVPERPESMKCWVFQNPSAKGGK